MKRRHLESALSIVHPFDQPSIQLEQVPTSPHLASHILFTAHETFDDIQCKVVADLGVGTGMLSIAAAHMGAAQVVGVVRESACNKYLYF